MVWCEKKKLIYVHIPKTGGTSIESYLNLKTKKKGNFEKIGYGVKIFKGKKKALQHLTASEIKNLIGEDKFNQMDKFSIVRNPYSKIISEYSHFLHLTGPKYHGDDSPLIVNGVIINNFDQFLNHVDNIVKNKLYDQNMFYDHFKPQFEFIQDNTDNLIDNIYKFEQLDTVKMMLKEKYPTNGALFPHSQKRKKKKINLSLSQKDKIYAIYQNDFKIFNYPK